MAASSDPVPAITEAEATGHVAELYADIRATLGVPVVNLIWRHLATMPGALEWTWSSVRPLYVSGQVANASAHLRQSMQVPALPVWPVAALQAAGLDAPARAGIAQVLASYDRSNAMNLVALSALRARSGGSVDPTAIPTVDPGTDIKGKLPLLVPVGEMPAATAELVLLLNAIGDPQQRVLASMYRHLSHWPAFLALVWTRLSPLQADGSIDRIIAQNLQIGRGIGAQLADKMPPLAGDLAPAIRQQAEASLDLFILYAIGRMVPIGRMLTAAFPAEQP